MRFDDDWLVERATESLNSGDAAGADGWLASVDAGRRPSSLVAKVSYALAKDRLSIGEWIEAEDLLARAVAADPGEGLYQRRLALLRRRSPGLGDDAFAVMDGRVDPIRRLPPNALAPALGGVWACGAFIAYGSPRENPWTEMVRKAKYPEREDHEAALTLVTGYFCRWAEGIVPLLAGADVVASIPANPDRYASRHKSLPDELARSLETRVGIPWSFEALSWVGADDVQLRGKSRAERQALIHGTMAVGDADAVEGKAVLVVDDVLTHGTTLSEAARLLRLAGAIDVLGAVLAHTEG